MSGPNASRDIEQRMQLARELFAEHPDKFSALVREVILAQRVEMGMSPYEAYLAAGQFVFRVQADPAMWPPNSDPYKVMWAQSLRPDASRIWMTFQTETQFPGAGTAGFRVFFRSGRAVEIERLETQGDPT